MMGRSTAAEERRQHGRGGFSGRNCCKSRQFLLRLLTAGTVLWLVVPSPCGAYSVKREDVLLQGGEMLCISGTAQGAREFTCPTTTNMHDYDAVVMDGNGLVHVTLKDVTMRDDGRRRHGNVMRGDAFYYQDDEDEEGDLVSGGKRSPWWWWRRQLGGEEGENTPHPDPVPMGQEREGIGHRIQVFLVPLDDSPLADIDHSRCCFELEFDVEWSGRSLPIECSQNDFKDMGRHLEVASSGEPLNTTKSPSNATGTPLDIASNNDKNATEHDNKDDGKQEGDVNGNSTVTESGGQENDSPDGSKEEKQDSSSSDEQDTDGGAGEDSHDGDGSSTEDDGKQSDGENGGGTDGPEKNEDGAGENPEVSEVGEPEPEKKEGQQEPSPPTETTPTTPSAGGASTRYHDFRQDMPRTGQSQHASIRIEVNSGVGRDIDFTLKPTTRGRYMLVISNCAADVPLNSDSLENRKSETQKPKAEIKSMEIVFVTQHGELPLSMRGIIPFYGGLLTLYILLSLAWGIRSRMGARVWGRFPRPWKRRSSENAKSISTMPLLGLQRAIRTLVFAQAIFSAIAYSYYRHLNHSEVNLHVLHSGTMALLVSWDPWSLAVATAHFCTIFGFQVVVTLATDGTWLIQHNVRQETKRAICAMTLVWFLYFAVGGFLGFHHQTVVVATFGIAWVLFLLYNVQRSLQHLKSLLVGQGNDTIIAMGGALVAKRSLYLKICIAIAAYPMIFLITVAWTAKSRKDSWMWVGYVLVDIYALVILMHASVIWMPRPMASQEYIKYAPLEIAVANNDVDLWEGSIRERWNEEEIELSKISQ